MAHAELEHVRDVQAAYLLLRCSLSVRFHFLLRTVGATLAAPPGGALTGPLVTHDARLRRSLSYLLVDPGADSERRDALAEAALGEERLFQQAQLRARDGGLTLAGADVLWASAHLSGAVACLPYVQTYAAELRLDAASCAADSTLPCFDGRLAALRRLRE